jgi:hypothetical protein
MKKVASSIWAARAAMLLLGASLLLSGSREILSSDFHYSNYWGGGVFAPLAIVIGVLLLAGAIWKWRTLTTTEKQPKLKGRAARLARKADATQFPIDDYKKW